MKHSSIGSDPRGARPQDHQAAGFDDVIATVADQMNAAVGLLILPDLLRPGQSSISVAGLPNPEVSAESRGFGQALLQLIRQHQRALMISDSRLQSDLVALPLVRASGCMAYLAVPILDRDARVSGALCIAHHAPHLWTDSDLMRLQVFAGFIERDMHQRRKVEDAKRAMADMRARWERERMHNFQREAIFQAMATPGLDSSARFIAVLNAGCAALKADYGVLTRVRDGRIGIIATSRAAPDHRVDTEQSMSVGYTAEILSLDRQICLPDTDTGNMILRKDLFGHSPVAFFGAPITTHGFSYGTLEFSATKGDTLRSDASAGSVLSMMAIAVSGHLCARLTPDQPDSTTPAVMS
ncbi:MAG: GAF domain-containing protein [Pseudomonadota bacterium]